MKQPVSRFAAIIAVALAIIALLAYPKTSQAQQGGWSEAVNLSNSESQSNTPSMTVDPSGAVHVVWVEVADDGRSFISYARFADGGWSPANEIMTSPIYQDAESPSIAADSRGYLHLVWRGDINILHSSAYAPMAGAAQSWSKPRALEYMEEDLRRPQLVIDAQDVLHLVYAIIIGSNSGIYYMQSNDYGATWSDPVSIYKNASPNRMVDYPRLAVGPDGGLHAAWVEFNYPESFPAIGIRYAASKADGESWSEAISLADGPYHFPDIITRGQDEVHVVFSGTGTDRYKFHTWSADGGKTWSEPWRNTDLGGYQGVPALTVDADQTIHWLTIGSIFGLNTHGLYHAEWKDDRWQPGEVPLVSDFKLMNPMDVDAAVALGNELFVAVEYPLASNEQPQTGQFDILIIRKVLNASHSQPTPLANPTPVSQLVIDTPASEKNAATAEALPIVNQQQVSALSNKPFTVITLGVLASMVILAAILFAARKNPRL